MVMRCKDSTSPSSPFSSLPRKQTNSIKPCLWLFPAMDFRRGLIATAQGVVAVEGALDEPAYSEREAATSGGTAMGSTWGLEEQCSAAAPGQLTTPVSGARGIVAPRHSTGRRRSSLVAVLGAVCIGCVLVGHTLTGGLAGAARAGGRKGAGGAAGAMQALHQVFRGDAALAAASKATGARGAARGPAQERAGFAAEQELQFGMGSPSIAAVVAPHVLMRAVGGQLITILGRNLGDEDAALNVRIGETNAAHTSWVSSHTLLAKTPPGIGGNLDVTVEVEEPAQPVKTAVAKGAFSYSRPFIFDMSPFVVGQPVVGPINVTIKAYGLGAWDTNPEALIDGQKCGATTWIDNQTVVCSIKDGLRLNLENPEVKVAGQRSQCGIIVPGVCTVAQHGGSVNSVSRLKNEISALRARGVDTNTLKKAIRDMKARQGIFLGQNDGRHPCDNLEDCYPRTILSSVVSGILMMMGMGSFFLLLLSLRPLFQWIHKEFLEEEEELDDDDPNNVVALRAREFDPRFTLNGL